MESKIVLRFARLSMTAGVFLSYLANLGSPATIEYDLLMNAPKNFQGNFIVLPRSERVFLRHRSVLLVGITGVLKAIPSQTGLFRL